MTTTTTTFIDTNTLPRLKTPHGEVTEILNRQLVGAKHVFGMLRWLQSDEKFEPEVTDKHQLIYFMEGKGTIRLDDKDYEVSRGAGIYLGPSETASIQAAGATPVKLFHLIVPKIPA